MDNFGCKDKLNFHRWNIVEIGYFTIKAFDH